MTLIQDNKEQKRKLLKVFRKNPSPLSVTPMNMKYIDIALAEGIKYFFITNKDEELVGVIGFRQVECMPLHLVIEYDQRGKGYGISAFEELEKIKLKEGIEKFWVQVYKDNARMLNLMLSLGYDFAEDREAEQYYVMVKQLSKEPGGEK